MVYSRRWTCFWCSLGPDVCCVLRLSGPLKQQYAQVRPTPVDQTCYVGYCCVMLILWVLQEHGLDLDQLLGTGLYKEQHRADMIHWGETRRCQDPGFFCRLATRGAQQPVWVRHCWCHVLLLLHLPCCPLSVSSFLLNHHVLPSNHLASCSLIGQVVSDARRMSDLQWFWSEFPRQTQSVRVQSSEKTRRERGWSFAAGQVTYLCIY